MKKFDNSVCLVTGGSSGIGRGIAIEFAKEGAFVVVTDIQEKPKTGKYHDTDLSTTTLEEIQNIGGKGIFIKTDVSNDNEIINLVEKIKFSVFRNFLGNVSFSYSTNINPFARFTAVSTLSANLLPKEELIIILSTKIEISCFTFLFNSGAWSIL